MIIRKTAVFHLHIHIYLKFLGFFLRERDFNIKTIASLSVPIPKTKEIMLTIKNLQDGFTHKLILSLKIQKNF